MKQLEEKYNKELNDKNDYINKNKEKYKKIIEEKNNKIKRIKQ